MSVRHQTVKTVKKLERPLIVFDSGVGGLTVLHTLINSDLRMDYLYVSDASNLPYGNKSDAFIQDRLANLIERVSSEVEASGLLLACNTATAAAIDPLREAYQSDEFPIFGIEPAVKPAVECSQTRHVAVLATPVTLESPRFKALLTRYAAPAGVICHPCPAPELVLLIEAHLSQPSAITKSALEERVKHYGEYVINHDCDALLLGCTHYNLLINMIKLYLLNIKIIDNRKGISNIVKIFFSNKKMVVKNNDKSSEARVMLSDINQFPDGHDSHYGILKYLFNVIN